MANNTKTKKTRTNKKKNFSAPGEFRSSPMGFEMDFDSGFDTAFDESEDRDEAS